jgi:hypothetical protein
MLAFIIGMNSALSAVAGLAFFKFWLTTRDRLFILFATAFFILAVDWAVLTMLRHFSANPTEHNILIYSVRLLAFILILSAIIDKNRRGSENATWGDLAKEKGVGGLEQRD